MPIRLLYFSLYCLLLTFSHSVHSMVISHCFSYNNSNYQCSGPNLSEDFNDNMNDNLSAGAFGSMGNSPMDVVNYHLQTRNQVPPIVKREMQNMQSVLQADTQGQFSSGLKQSFQDLKDLIDGIQQVNFLPASFIPPPIPTIIDKPKLRQDLQNFYQETKDSNYIASKNKINETIARQASAPSDDDKFWWNEIRRNHVDANGIMTSTPYQNLEKLNISNAVTTTQGQFIRHELNNAMANHATNARQYLQGCHDRGDCISSIEQSRHLLQMNAQLQNTQAAIKFLDENSSWGYDSGNLANLISAQNNSNEQFALNNPTPTAEQVQQWTAEHMFQSSVIDEEVKKFDNGVQDFAEWPTYKTKTFKDNEEQSNQDSSQMAKCIASIHLCKISGQLPDLLNNPIPTLANTPANTNTLKALAREKQILGTLKLRNQLEQVNWSGVSGSDYLRDIGRYSSIASASLALAGSIGEAEGFQKITQEALDIGLGLTPGVSIGKDLYELISGKNLVSGKELDTFDRVLAGVGVLSLGTSNYAKTFIKGAGKFLKYTSGTSINAVTESMGKVYKAATDIFPGNVGQEQITGLGDYLRKSGDDILNSPVDEVVTSSRPYFKGWKKHYKFEKKVDAKTVNDTFTSTGRKAPYKEGSQTFEFKTGADDQWARVHGDTNQSSSWMMRKDAIKGLTPLEIQKKYALPKTPTHVSEVHVPKGTRIRKGKVGKNDFGNVEGAVQYELLDRIPVESFKNSTPIGGVVQ